MASFPRIDELRKKFEENPRRYFAPLANEYRKAGDIDRAIDICREYLPQQPGHMSGHIVYGQALYEARQFEEARTVFETALSLDPENLIALRHLGDIALIIGDTDGARSWYRRVLEADPRNEEIQAQLATLDQTIAAAQVAASAPTPSSTATVPPAESRSTPTIDASSVRTPHSAPVASDAPTVEVHVDAAPTTPVSLPGIEKSTEAWLDLPASGRTTPVAAPQAPPAQVAEALPATPAEPVAADAAADAAATQRIEPPRVEATAPASAPPTGPSRIEGLETAEFIPPSRAQQSGAPPAAAERAEAAASTAPPPAAPETEAASGPTADLPLLDLGEPTPQVASAPVPEAVSPLAYIGMEGRVEDGPSDAPPAAPESGPFVTETMAELYLRQGHRDEALRVYRALLDQRPDDASLRAKIESLSPSQSGPTMREVLTIIAARRPGFRPEVPQQNGAHAATAAPAPQPEAPRSAIEQALPTAAAPEPAASSAPAANEVVPAGPDDRLAALFARATVTAEDESAAIALAAAFSGVNGEHESAAGVTPISGAPARPAEKALSLDTVFGAEAQPAAANFSFDQFFSERSTAEMQAARREPAGGAPASGGSTGSGASASDDIAEFTRWLEGLKRR